MSKKVCITPALLVSIFPYTADDLYRAYQILEFMCESVGESFDDIELVSAEDIDTIISAVMETSNQQSVVGSE